MESGLAREMLSSAGLKPPRSCNRLALISAAPNGQFLKKQNATLTHSTMKELKAIDAKITDKLFYFELNAEKTYSMKGGMQSAELLLLAYALPERQRSGPALCDPQTHKRLHLQCSSSDGKEYAPPRHRIANSAPVPTHQV